MAKFAVYTVSPADNLLYQQGSEILGYDVRRIFTRRNWDSGATEALDIAIPKFVSYQMQWFLQKAHQLHASLMP